MTLFPDELQQFTRHYPSDLTDAQWQLIADILDPPPKSLAGRQPTIPRREILDAILYVVREGCRWRSLPTHYPNWSTVYWHFRHWLFEGVFFTAYTLLHTTFRLRNDREAHPSLGILDSQSVKSTALAQEAVGYDAAKSIKGRKRHIITDTLGYPFVLQITGGNIQDYTAGVSLVAEAKLTSPRLKRILCDGIYQALANVLKDDPIIIEVVKRPRDTKGFIVQPKRWVVERVFGWLGNYRRLARDYERRIEVSLAMITVALLHLLVRRLAPAQAHWADKRRAAQSAAA
jgi:putative transposase